MSAFDIVFLLDIGCNFLTSYKREGTEVTHPRAIADHYVKTVFFVDLLANLPVSHVAQLPGFSFLS